MEEELIIKYEPLIYKIAHKFYNVELSDLYQAGCIGLIKAYRNYNKDCNNSFINFAYMYIYGEMYDFVNNSRNIKIQKDNLRLLKNIYHAKEIIFNKTGKYPSTKELSAFLEIDENLINDLILLSSEPLSIEEAKEEYNIEAKDYYYKWENIDNKILINESLSTLNKLEHQIIIDRYFNDLTQSETAKKLGISQVKVSRIEQKGKAKIKEYIKT